MRRLLAWAANCAIASGLVAISTINAQTIRQITDARAGNSLFPRLDATGATVVWPSSADPSGTNLEHAFQLFRADPLTGAVTQVTSARGGAALTASVSDDGQRVVFSGSGNPTGGNHDGNVEIFVALRDGTGIRQLTLSTEGSSDAPVLCGNGSRIVFTSVANLTGGNADHSQEIFVVDWNGAELRQLTDGAGDSGAPHITDDGTKIVFTTSQNPLGTNPDSSTEVFAINADGTGLRQLTSSAGNSSAPWIAGNGTNVVFQSDGDLTGGNPDLGSEVFVVRWDGTGLRQLTNSKQLLGADGVSGAPSVDDTGTTVVFQSNQLLFLSNLDGNYEIWKMRTDGTGLTALTNSLLELGSFFPAISGDGTRVAFLSLADLTGSNADKNPEVFTIKSDKTGLRQISNGVWAFNTGSALASDGSRIAFTSSADPTGGNADRNVELFAIDADGSGLAQLTSSTGLLSSAGAPSISGDGTRIAFSSTANYLGGNADAGSEIYAINADGTGLRQLTADGSKGSSAPKLATDGGWIAFVSEGNLTGGNADGNAEIFAVSWDGTGLIQLTASATGASGSPSISSDGSRIAFDSTADLVPGRNPEGNREVFAIQSNGTGLIQLTASATGASGAPSLRGDGARLVFQSTADLVPGGNADANAEIFAIDTAGTNLAQLTATTAGGSGSPVFSENGQTVTFASSAPYGGPNPDRIADLWRTAPDGSALTRLTGMHAGGASSASVSADGARVAFTALGNITGANPDQTPETFLIERNRPWNIAVSGTASTLVSFDPFSGAYTYDVCRGSLGGLSLGAGVVNLGPLVCLDEDSPEPNTIGFEDTAPPAQGAGFFYLVRPADGLVAPSYGQGTGGRERQPGSGDCAP
jgi:TolB protein